MWQPEKYNVVTNHHHRPVLGWEDLTDAERDEFDWVAPMDRPHFEAFRYRGSVYFLGDFDVATDRIRALGFAGHQTQSYFDAVAIKVFDEDGHYHGDESVVVAHIHW